MEKSKNALCELCLSVILLQLTFWKTLFFFFLNLLYASCMVTTGHQVFTVKLQPLDGSSRTNRKYHVELKAFIEGNCGCQRK